jgi:hypothetical protein
MKIKYRALILGLVIFALLSGGCLEKPFGTKEARSGEVKLGKVKIQAEPIAYSPIMSSTPGIGLTPLWTLGRPMKDFDFHWNANYGFFLNWGPPDYKVEELGGNVINKGEKIYWSYDPNDMGKEKPSVKISLTIGDVQSGKILTVSYLEIEWEDQDMAKVKGDPV